MTQTLRNKNILLVISGGIAAYKALELIRLLRKNGAHVEAILTQGGAQFITPLVVSALTERPAYTDLWSLKDETEMGHIRLSRQADLIVIAPASANMIAKMANGLADDLASTMLLAADKEILIAPAMNHKMWSHPATRDNMQRLSARGVHVIGPVEGDMACGEYGMGRMAEPQDILDAIQKAFLYKPHPDTLPKRERGLMGLSAIVTSGPTFEPIDPVRFMGNRSSGKQGHAIAAALAEAGASVTLITGPVALPDPANVKTIHVETAKDMLQAVQRILPADIAVCAAAISDWAPAVLQAQKIKKKKGENPPDLKLTENPDILKTIAAHEHRPRLVIGFAAETENLIENAKAKRAAKNCDWILANAITEAKKVFCEDENHVYLITNSGAEDWRAQSKKAVAEKLVQTIGDFFNHEERAKKAAQ